MCEHESFAILGSVSDFLEELVSKTEDLGIVLDGKEIDHICYRAASLPEYRDIFDKLHQCGCLLVESMIGGRPIATFQLNQPLAFKQWEVRCIELASPKPGRIHHHGLEHAEVVIGTTSHDPHFSEQLLLDFIQKYPDIQFDKRAIKKKINADVSITIREGMSVKFHARPLYEVIEEEKSLGLVEPVPADYFSINS